MFHMNQTIKNKRRHNNQGTLDQQHDIKNDFRSAIETSEMESNLFASVAGEWQEIDEFAFIDAAVLSKIGKLRCSH